MMTTNGLILIVDDNHIIRRKIAEALAQGGFSNVMEAGDGLEALKIIQTTPPDLILLDHIMPNMDGMETCRRLREMPDYKDIPVLFVTASGDITSQWKAFEVGAEDYITKPFHPMELLARVRTHLDLFLHRKADKIRASEMEKLAAERGKQLLHADRLATLGTLTAGVVHELRNPLTYVNANIQIFQKGMGSLKGAIDYACENGKGDAKLKMMTENIEQILVDVRDGTKRMEEIIDSVRRYSREPEKTMTPVNIQDVVRDAMAITNNRTKHKLDVAAEIPPQLPQVRAGAMQLTQVFVNLIINASDAADAKGRAALKITAQAKDNKVECAFADTACGMPQEVMAHLFEPFFTTKGEAQGTGLGLNISKQIIAAHGGDIKVESVLGSGTTFTIILPAIGN